MILRFDNVLQTDLYKCVHRKFFWKWIAVSNFILGTVGTISLGTRSLSKNFLMHWPIIWKGQLLHLKILFGYSTSMWKFFILEKILKYQNKSMWTKPTLQVPKIKMIFCVIIRINSTKNGFVKNWSKKPFLFRGNFDI